MNIYEAAKTEWLEKCAEAYLQEKLAELVQTDWFQSLSAEEQEKIAAGWFMRRAAPMLQAGALMGGLGGNADLVQGDVHNIDPMEAAIHRAAKVKEDTHEQFAEQAKAPGGRTAGEQVGPPPVRPATPVSNVAPAATSTPTAPANYHSYQTPATVRQVPTVKPPAGAVPGALTQATKAVHAPAGFKLPTNAVASTAGKATGIAGKLFKGIPRL